jgi:3',5'-cyclic-AMP phosphodiesterase
MSRLTLRHLDSEPVHHVRVLNARSGGGTETTRVPILLGVVDGLPDSLDGLIIAGDLQGRAPAYDGLLQLSGVTVAEELAQLAEEGTLPPLSRMGAVFTGDLYIVPDASKRGGFGDVSPVWRAFLERCAWVTGVAGNHDDVSALPPAAVLLDGTHASFDGLRIGGVGLICGNAAKPGRRDEVEQLAAIELMSGEALDLLVLHEGPDGAEGQRGHPRIGTVAPFIVCGHVHWKVPLFVHEGGVVLNVDSRVVVLRRAE